MLPAFIPVDWYWLADDGRLFSTARFAIVAKGDAAHAAWCEAHRFGLPGHFDDEGDPVTMPLAATAWPRDAAGAQTDAALDAVLRPYGLSMAGPLREAYGDDLLGVLTDAEVAAMSSASPRDQRTFSIQRAPFVETDATVVAIAAAVKVDPKAWFDRLFKAA